MRGLPLLAAPGHVQQLTRHMSPTAIPPYGDPKLHACQPSTKQEDCFRGPVARTENAMQLTSNEIHRFIIFWSGGRSN